METRQVVDNNENDKIANKTAKDKVKSDVIVLFLVFLALILSMIGTNYYLPPEEATIELIWSHEGGLSEPFTIEKENALARVEIRRLERFKQTGWDVLNIDVLDENKQPQGGLVMELWRDKGTDGEERWDAEDVDSQFEYFFTTKGQYFINLNIETSVKTKHQYLYQGLVYPNVDANIYFRRLTMFLFIATIIAVLRAARHIEG